MFNLSDRIENLTHRIADLGDELSDALPNDLDFDLPDDLDPDPDSDLVYLAIGASDAVGIGATPITNGYVYQVADGLEQDGTDVRLVNLGVPDAELDLLLDVAQGALRLGPEPDVATVWVGANDLIEDVGVEEFAQNLDQLLDDLEETGALVAIADIPDLTQLPRFRDNPDPDVTGERIAAFNEAIRQEAEEHGAVLVRLSGEPVEDRFVSDADGFHPNDLGHERIAELFLDALEPELAGTGTTAAADLDPFA